MSRRTGRVASRATVIAMLTGGLIGFASPSRAETYPIDSRAVFVAAMPHLPVDDFETATLEGIMESCGSLVSAERPTGCFDAGGLQPGIMYLTNTHPDPENYGIAARPTSNHGSASKMLLADRPPAALIIGFTTPVDTVGFDLGVEYYGSTCEVSVFYVDGSAPDEFTIDCRAGMSEPRFVGLTSDRLIRGIQVAAAGNNNEYIDNVRFGLRAPNDFAVSAVRKHRASGSATVVVNAPCAGVTSVKGSGIVPARARARTDETVRVTVKPTDATKRKLNRTGKATVTLEISFSPTGGVPATSKRRVTLVKGRR